MALVDDQNDHPLPEILKPQKLQVVNHQSSFALQVGWVICRMINDGFAFLYST